MLEEKPILIVRNLSDTYAEQQQLFQAARDAALEHERLMREIQKKEILLHCIIHDLSQPLNAMRGVSIFSPRKNFPASSGAWWRPGNANRSGKNR